MRILVQKFGGTSVASEDQRRQVAEKVIQARRQGFATVVVISAMGREGEPYATDTLLKMASSAKTEAAPREMDLLMSCGEVISGVVMASTLRDMGEDAVMLTGAQAGIITTQNFGDARIQEIRPQNIFKHLEEGKIVLVAGFQGVTDTGDVTTLGRGGSDTSAAALGVALNAEAVDIYTDVEGIMTADPRIVENARTLDKVTYNEICQLAWQGAKVIHPRAVEIAMQHNLPLRVKGTFSNSPGTLVGNWRGEIDPGVRINEELVTGITQIPNVTQLKFRTTDLTDRMEYVRKIFTSLALAGISVDLINVHPEITAFTVRDPEAARAIAILQNGDIQPEVLPDCAKVSVIGAGMAGIPGVMARIVEALTKEQIQILQTADSHTTIWVLVRRADMEKAVCALHEAFQLGFKIEDNNSEVKA